MLFDSTDNDTNASPFLTLGEVLRYLSAPEESWGTDAQIQEVTGISG